MVVKILHTADNHIGLSFARYPSDVRERLVEERFSALEQLVKNANERQANFIVVAGDLFDKQTVTKKLVERTASILAGFEGDHVLVLAGNHDFYEGSDNRLWNWFKAAAEGTCIIPLLEQETKEFDLDVGRVRFYACPCPSKHGADHVIGWVADEEKEPEVLHVGIAHGNVEGFGLDTDQRYFNMSESDLQGAGLDTWLLGHLHVPFPANGTSGKPHFFMSGTHTPDSIKCSHPGHAWWIEMSADGACQFEQLNSDSLRFIRDRRSLEHANDIQALAAACEKFDLPNTVLDLQLSGRLAKEEMDALRRLYADLSEKCLYFSHDSTIAPVLDAAAIANEFPDGTLPNSLLLELLADQEHPGDAHLAFEIIESINVQ